MITSANPSRLSAMSLIIEGVSETKTTLGLDILGRLLSAFLRQSNAACFALTDLQAMKISSDPGWPKSSLFITEFFGSTENISH